MTLHSFSVLVSGTNCDGAEPYHLILSGDTLYGTAIAGGSAGRGTVFAVNTDGTDFRFQHSFTSLSNGYPRTNSDGSFPYGLVVSGNRLYGVAAAGGIS